MKYCWGVNEQNNIVISVKSKKWYRLSTETQLETLDRRGIFLRTE